MPIKTAIQAIRTIIFYVVFIGQTFILAILAGLGVAGYLQLAQRERSTLLDDHYADLEGRKPRDRR